MKNVILILILFLSFSCKTSKVENPQINFFTDVYESIINNLSKNYTLLNTNNSQSFFELFPVSENFYNKEKELYKATLKEIPTLSINYVKYLFLFEDKTDTYCQWVRRKHPSSSIIKEYEILTKSKAALILIDNYLIGDNSKLIVSEYVEKLNYNNLRRFVNTYGNLEVEIIREHYKEFVIDLEN